MFLCYRKKGNSDEAEKGVNKIFKILCALENDIIRPRTINILERNVVFSKTCGQILDTTFSELCDRVSSITNKLTKTNSSYFTKQMLFNIMLTNKMLFYRYLELILSSLTSTYLSYTGCFKENWW